jgi:uncharacterized membrane protein
LYNNKQDRIRSKAVWVSVISLILLIFNSFGIFEKIGADETAFKTIFEMILTILVGFGILNNPTDKENF